MNRSIEAIRQYSSRIGIGPNPHEAELWASAYSVDPNRRLPINQETGVIASGRFHDTLSRMGNSTIPHFRTAVEVLNQLTAEAQLDTVLEGSLKIRGREAGASVEVAEGKFGIRLRVNMAAILNHLSQIPLATMIAHEVGGHAKSRRDYYQNLDSLALAENEKAELVRTHFRRDKVADEATAYGVQSEAVIFLVGYGLEQQLDNNTLEIAAMYCQTVKRGYDQRWMKYISPKV